MFRPNKHDVVMYWNEVCEGFNRVLICKGLTRVLICKGFNRVLICKELTIVLIWLLASYCYGFIHNIVALLLNT